MIGHVGVITAFNFPVAVWFWNAALSLVCGNTNMWKPSDTTSLCAIAATKIVASVLEQEKVPGAVASLVAGPGLPVGEALLQDHKMELVRHVLSLTACGMASILTDRSCSGPLAVSGLLHRQHSGRPSRQQCRQRTLRQEDPGAGVCSSPLHSYSASALAHVNIPIARGAMIVVATMP